MVLNYGERFIPISNTSRSPWYIGVHPHLGPIRWLIRALIFMIGSDDTIFVGREKELQDLIEFARHARSGTGVCYQCHSWISTLGITSQGTRSKRGIRQDSRINSKTPVVEAQRDTGCFYPAETPPASGIFHRSSKVSTEKWRMPGILWTAGEFLITIAWPRLPVRSPSRARCRRASRFCLHKTIRCRSPQSPDLNSA